MIATLRGETLGSRELDRGDLAALARLGTSLGVYGKRRGHGPALRLAHEEQPVHIRPRVARGPCEQPWINQLISHTLVDIPLQDPIVVEFAFQEREWVVFRPCFQAMWLGLHAAALTAMASSSFFQMDAAGSRRRDLEGRDQLEALAPTACFSEGVCARTDHQRRSSSTHSSVMCLITKGGPPVLTAA
jgi:hypothetical protein